VQPTVIPLPGGGTVDPADELFVYTSLADSDAAATATSTAPAKTPPPQRMVNVYDLTQGKKVASFPFGARDDPSVRASLAGDEVVTATERKVVIQRLDGSAPRQLYAAPATGAVLDIDVSADARLVAIVARSEKKNAQTAIVRVIYLVSGGKALTIAVGDPRFGDFQGTFGMVHWQTTDKAAPSFVIAGETEEGHTPSNAVVALNGVVKATHPSGPAWLSPDGAGWALTDKLVCTGPLIGGHHLSVQNIGADKPLWQTQDTRPIYTPVEWSPDGQTLIYATRPDAPSSCDTSIQAPVQLYQVDLKTGQASAVADLGALHQQWYGQALVTAGCAGSSANPVKGRWQHFEALCGTAAGATPVTVSVGGTEAGKALDPVPVGIIHPPDTKDDQASAAVSAG
jgi:hypothetical protein